MPQFARGRLSQVLRHPLSVVRATRLLAVVVVAMACNAVALATSAQAAGCPQPEVVVTSFSPLACSAPAATPGLRAAAPAFAPVQAAAGGPVAWGCRNGAG